MKQVYDEENILQIKSQKQPILYSTGLKFAIEFALRVGLGIAKHFMYGIPIFIREVQTEDWAKHNYPYKKETISANSSYWMFFFMYLVMVVVVELVAFDNCYQRYKFSKKENNDTTLISKYKSELTWYTIGERQGRLFFSYSLGILTSQLFCDFLKFQFGHLRPDYLDRCKPPMFDRLNPDFKSLGFIPKCQQENEILLIIGRTSFPSNHSSNAMLTFTYLSIFIFYITGRTSVNKLYGLRYSLFWGLLLPGIYISVTRYSDYRHHIEDILCGLLLGIVFAYTSFIMYYKNVFEQEYSVYFEKPQTSPLLDFDQLKSKLSFEDTNKHIKTTTVSKLQVTVTKPESVQKLL